MASVCYFAVAADSRAVTFVAADDNFTSLRTRARVCVVTIDYCHSRRSRACLKGEYRWARASRKQCRCARGGFEMCGCTAILHVHVTGVAK